MNVRNNSDASREETLERAMDDPEVQQILADPVMRKFRPLLMLRFDFGANATGS